jgi:thioredoxin-disulfide reductase
MKYDVIILGSGVVGLGAAVYCGRLGLSTLVIGRESGGTIIKTDFVENYPGFRKITGGKLANNIFNHVKDYGVKILSGNILKVSWSRVGCFKVRVGRVFYSSKTVLFATGAEWRKLDVPGGKEFENKGVHYCALCDGPVYKGKSLVVVGGGDSAAKEALLLAKYAKQVYVLARSKLRAESINLKRVLANKKIRVIEGIEVKEINGGKFVEEIVLTKKIGDSNNFKVDGVFVSIGNIPLSSLAVSLGVKVNKKGEIKINKDSKTNVTGIWAAGDVTDSKFKQAITGVGEGVKAAYGIYEYLNGENVLCV